MGLTLEYVYEQKQKEGLYKSSLDRSLENYKSKRILTVSDVFEDISDWFYNTYYEIRRIIEGIIRVFKYVHITFNSYDWDFEYLLDLVEFKLKLMKKSFDKDECINQKECLKISKEINSVLRLIHNYKNCEEAFGKQNQDLLEDLLKTKTTKDFDKGLKDYYIKMQDFEIETYKSIWTNIAKFSLNWWS